MTPETLFSVCNTGVLPGWLLLIVAPGWRWTQRIATCLLAIPLALVYLWLFVTHAGGSGGFGSLSQVAQLFAQPAVLLAGWIHYLIFDLFVGSWEVRDARRLGISHGLVIPCLLLTFLLGPIGLLLYWLLRLALKRQIDLG